MTEKLFDMRICSCGRIHMVRKNVVDRALKHNKNLLLICAGCGRAMLIGADVERNVDTNRSNYNMYSWDFSPYTDKTISLSSFKSTDEQKGIEEIFYSHGLKVPMMTGNYATRFFYGKFYDESCPTLELLRNKNVTPDYVYDFIDGYYQKQKTVDMARLIAETDDNILNEISSYRIEGLEWSGTKWEDN